MNASAAPSFTEFPRRHVPATLEFGDWSAIEPLYRELAERPIRSVEELDRWLTDVSEVDAAFDEEAAKRHVEMTQQTDDPAREQRFLHFIENVRPHREPWHNVLRKRFVELSAAYPLPKKRFEVLQRSARTSIEIFRDENIPLQTEDQVLQTQYQKITGSMTCTYQCRELTLQQLGRFQEEPDRAVREQTWRLASDRFLQDANALDQIYGKMVAVRHQMAQNAACRDYREYAFKAMERFDYTPADCMAFHDAIEKVIVPACKQLGETRRKKLGVPTLRPWDTSVDPDGRAPLRPFESDEQLAAGCSRIFHKVNPELGGVFDRLRAAGMLDLGSRKGKAPGGYQAMYDERRVPFIFMNAVGTEGDVRTLLHEGGHAFHSWACRQEPLLAYRHSPIEFAEVASMGMELLALPHVEEFYGADANRSRKRFFQELLGFFPWMARVDAFQHYVYTHVNHDPERRKDEWQKLTRRFSTGIDWSGLEAYDRVSWHRKLHFFEVPFYYVEYGIAQLGALQVWMNARKDYDQAVALYRNGLALGGARPLPELFEAAGLKFDFSERTLRPLVDAVMEEIGRL